jgi:hypothetical protein
LADNIQLNSGSGGSIMAADDISSVFYPRSKIIHGADGTNDGDVSTANPFPVRLYIGTTAVSVGAGAVGTGVPRVTLASDDPAVALLTTMDADTGGILTAIQIMDDWDESDRAKVNLIVGQAGIAAGAGAVGATVPRVTLASDDPGVALLTTIDTDTGNIATSLAVMDDWDNAASDGASVSGDVAHDGVDAGEPVKMGAKAVATLSSQTLVAANDRTNVFADLDGALVSRPHCTLGDLVSGVASNTDGASTEVIATAGAGVKQYLTSVTLINSSASFAYCELKSGTTVKWRFPVPATGGVTHTFSPPLPPNAADEAWNFDMSAATTTAYCSMVGFKSKV